MIKKEQAYNDLEIMKKYALEQSSENGCNYNILRFSKKNQRLYGGISYDLVDNNYLQNHPGDHELVVTTDDLKEVEVLITLSHLEGKELFTQDVTSRQGQSLSSYLKFFWTTPKGIMLEVDYPKYLSHYSSLTELIDKIVGLGFKNKSVTYRAEVSVKWDGHRGRICGVGKTETIATAMAIYNYAIDNILTLEKYEDGPIVPDCSQL